MKQIITQNSGYVNQFVSLFQVVTEVIMVTSEFNQANYVINFQCNIDQLSLIEVIPAKFRLKT